MNELIRELADRLEKMISAESDYVPHNEGKALIAKARAYLETGGWTRVEDGLPVVPDGDYDVEIWIVFPSGLVARWLWLDVDTEFDAGITHWRYAEPTPEPPKG